MIRIALLLAICSVIDDIESACQDFNKICAATKRHWCSQNQQRSTSCPFTCDTCGDSDCVDKRICSTLGDRYCKDPQVKIDCPVMCKTCCRDLHSFCSKVTQLQCTGAKFQKHCPKTCGVCGGGGCEDLDPGCVQLNPQQCENNIRVQMVCPSTCNTCGKYCEDLSRGCKQIKKREQCDSIDNAKKYCPKTCKACRSDCKDLSASCKYTSKKSCESKYTQQKCPKTCGICGGGCVDQERCNNLDQYFCNNGDVQRDCPKMCGRCGGGNNGDNRDLIENEVHEIAKRVDKQFASTEGSCLDLEGTCRTFYDKHCKNSQFLQKCPKTCGICGLCDDSNGGCHTDSVCTNTPGSRTCACKTGFTGDGFTCTDVDECRDGTHTCAAGFVCNNTPGSFACTCQVGFEVINGACQDVDECRDGTHTCADGFVCQNTPGSFACTCPDGFEVVDGACKALCTNVDVSIKTDEYPKEIAWKIGAGDDCKTAKDKDNYYNKHHVYTTTCCLTVGTHVLQCKDDYGDGWYHKNYATNIEYFGYIEIQGQKYCKERFTKSLTKTVAIKPVATCSDNKKNGDEEGVDCGGSCPACVCEDKPHGLCGLIFEDSHCGIWDILQEHCPSKCLLCEGEARTIICKNTRLGACVEWETLRLDTFADRTVKECKALCAANPECYSFARNRNTRRCNIFKRGCTENVNASDDWYECKDCEDTEDICSVIPFERCEDPNNEYLREKCPRSCRICGGARVQKRAANSSVLMALSNNLKM